MKNIFLLVLLFGHIWFVAPLVSIVKEVLRTGQVTLFQEIRIVCALGYIVYIFYLSHTKSEYLFPKWVTWENFVSRFKALMKKIL